jgi:hypothetical protein
MSKISKVDGKRPVSKKSLNLLMQHAPCPIAAHIVRLKKAALGVRINIQFAAVS